MSNTNNIRTLFDPHKFSISKIFSNNNGKTSSTKIIGFIVSIVCLMIFIMLVIYYFYNPGECANILEIIDRTVSYFSISAGLMGVKSITSSFGRQKIEILDNTQDNIKAKKKDNHKDNENIEEIEEIN